MLWIGRIEEYGQSNRILRNRAGNYGTRESSRDVLRLRVSAHGRVERDPPTCRLQDYSVPWYVFHLLVEQGLIYICATLPEASMHQSFTCLFLIKQRFLEGSLSSRAWTAQEHELDRDFGSVIADILNNCNSGRTGDQISQLHRQVEDVRGIMAQNIERVVERGDRLDSLLEKTQDLEQAGTVFRATAKKVNRHMCLRNARMMIVIGIIVAGVITIITLFATGIIKT
ncbi:vesicle-associated membrane protein 7-like isoform X3 [Dermacentor variabilis]|uniref:vesicle-associated membrane protein 7-like isoform X3 n=1 Tax=Dermacentor variabilis TaxID=34621 RepID=UPI003F5C5739